MISVYHNTKFTEFTFVDKERLPQKLATLQPHHLTLVAKVDTEDLQEAYRKTNHLDRDWKENPDVICYGCRNRSTSIGDVLEQGTKFYLVMPVDFVEITSPF